PASPFVVLLYCLHAPAPTAIYPLSLHDALPISLMSIGSPFLRLFVISPVHSSFFSTCRFASRKTSRGGCNSSSISRPVASSRVQDRKSTRLNSSHVKTSYAVFCLKKNIP